MKTRHTYGLAVALTCIGSISPALAQQSTLPEVEVQQKKAAAAKAKAAKKAAAPKPAPQPAAEPVVEEAPVEEASPLENSPYGATNSGPAAARAQNGSTAPINARSILPGDLQNYSGAGTRVTTDAIESNRPITNHEALRSVPGVVTVSDDGLARHAGIGIRGSAPRRARKVLVMEDGVPINWAPYIDSSTHYTPPLDRIESIEVLRGPIVNYGPLNNHGVVNFRNLSPFGGNETVISGAIGYTEGSDKNLNNTRHVHTRQNVGNVGVVASYSGGDSGGAWDIEELGYNDFYGAIGFRGSNQDLTISGGYFRQRDRYDESNFEGTEAQFFANGRNKVAGAAAGFFTGDDAEIGFENSSYNGEHYRLQATHNLYVNSDVTISTRAYATQNERDRYFPVDEDGDPTNLEMAGRDRDYENYGIESRAEIANLPLFAGMRHDLQFGVRYEDAAFANKNRVGAVGQVLSHNSSAAIDEQVNLDSRSFAAFVQTAIHVTKTLTIIPGLRFEDYKVDFEEVIGGTDRLSSKHDHVLPAISVAWEVMPRTTIYGGYHQGLTPHLVRDANDADGGFPLKEEVGDNYTIGVRSTAVRGLTFDVAYFYSDIENYQFKEAFTVNGNQVFASLDEVTLQGAELGARLESRPFTNSVWNFFGEAVYTYVDGEIQQGIDENGASVAGNTAPEVIEQFANLTLGFDHKAGFDASVTWTYVGEFFTDEINTPYGGDPDGTQGLVPDYWLLSARSNVKVTDQLSLFVTGQNLTDKFYISDRADGMKPGQGRTVMGGFTLKFE